LLRSLQQLSYHTVSTFPESPNFHCRVQRTQSRQKERLSPWIRNVIKYTPPKIIKFLSLRRGNSQNFSHDCLLFSVSSLHLSSEQKGKLKICIGDLLLIVPLLNSFYYPLISLVFENFRKVYCG